jgi:hypothetical protein
MPTDEAFAQRLEQATRKIEITYRPEAKELAESLAVLLRDLFAIRSSDVELVASSETTQAAGALVVILQADVPDDGAFAVRLLIGRHDAPVAHEGEACFDGTQKAALEDLLGRIAGALGLTAPIDIQRHRAELAEFARLARSKDKDRLRRLAGPLGVGAAALSLVGGAIAAIAYVAREGTEGTTERFGFEKDAHGWTAETAPGSRGCVGVARSNDVSKSGRFALRMDLELDGTSPDRASGEAWTFLSDADTEGVRGRTIVAWVNAARLEGAESIKSIKSAGFQLFVKDKNFRNCYGPWVSASRSRWTKLTVDASCDSSNHHVGEGFDRYAIGSLGVKIAVPTESATRLRGHLFVDSIGW